MSTPSPDGPARLHTAGIGSVIGGLLLAALSLLSPLSFRLLASLILLIGVGSWALEHRQHKKTHIPLGIVGVGGIGLLEAGGFGLGLDALSLGVIAVVVGGADVLAGGVLGRVGRGT